MKLIQKPVSILLSVIIVFSLFTVIPVTVSAATSIDYIDENGVSQTANSVKKLTSDTTYLTVG